MQQVVSISVAAWKEDRKRLELDMSYIYNNAYQIRKWFYSDPGDLCTPKNMFRPGVSGLVEGRRQAVVLRLTSRSQSSSEMILNFKSPLATSPLLGLLAWILVTFLLVATNVVVVDGQTVC